jgi:Uncharacterized protein conserved in bacteria
MTTFKKIGTCMLCLLMVSFARAQADKDLDFPSQVKQFYSVFPGEYAWLGNNQALQQFFNYLDSAAYLGLDAKDYQYNYISRFRAGKISLTNRQDSLSADYHITDAAIHFFRDVMVGNRPPAIGYNGLNYSPDWSLVPSMLSASLCIFHFEFLLQNCEPRSAEYLALKNQVIEHNKILNDTAYRKTVLGNRNDNKQTIATYKDQLAGLNRAINTVRWLDDIRQANQHIIVVNVPSASLLVFSPQGVAIESKVIVGQRTHRTPTLCSKIEDVVMYPYWMVPKSIATKELLPHIKRNPAYLDANGYQVVNDKGKVLNPYLINWNSLSTSYFPYTLRQSTGCDNSLGIVKLNFYNPFTVYLHDTPAKKLFEYSKRFYSHGCVRVEKAVELAKLAAKEKAGFIDSLVDKGCLPDQEPIVIPVQEKIPVFILYNTAWIDSTGKVSFYEDVYARFAVKK